MRPKHTLLALLFVTVAVFNVNGEPWKIDLTPVRSLLKMTGKNNTENFRIQLKINMACMGLNFIEARLAMLNEFLEYSNKITSVTVYPDDTPEEPLNRHGLQPFVQTDIQMKALNTYNKVMQRLQAPLAYIPGTDSGICNIRD